MIQPGTPTLDRPTLTALGVRLPLTGDDNLNAAVTVRYQKLGGPWHAAQPLYRVHPETAPTYTGRPEFAGSIMDLRPNTTYNVELHLTDPDGPVDRTFALSGKTRHIPGDPATPRVRNVADADSLRIALNNAAAGDVITLANSVYTGPFFVIYASGTDANPIVIRGASMNGVILDGDNCTTCNVIEIYGSYIHLENLSIRNAQRAVRFQTADTVGNVVRRVHISNTILGISGRATQYDFYIADNILEGRLQWPLVAGSDGLAHASDDGIQVTGDGMVVAHNRISGYGDAMKTESTGARSVDFYGNDVLWTYDNGIELDLSEGNVRALHNRFTNAFSPLSVQPVYLGPAYIARNVVVNTVDEQIKFHALGTTPPAPPNGVFVYHNTFLSPITALQVQTPNPSYHFALQNNLFIAPATLPGFLVNWDAPISDGVFDYNGYFPDGKFLFNWLPGGSVLYPNFLGLQNAGIETHGLLMTGSVFYNGMLAPTDYTILLPPRDATLAPSAEVVDKGTLLPNINDGFQASAPDLGALEVGCTETMYGPRPAGIDERNEPFGCEGASVLTLQEPTAAFAPIHVNAGGPPWIDQTGQLWSDSGYAGGWLVAHYVNVSNTATPAIYQTARGGPSTYTFAVPNGSYTVTLKFAEIVRNGPRQRLFNVFINGAIVLPNFDIFAAAGAATAIDKSFLVTVSGGRITVQLAGTTVGYPIINGIEIALAP